MDIRVTITLNIFNTPQALVVREEKRVYRSSVFHRVKGGTLFYIYVNDQMSQSIHQKKNVSI